MLLTKSKSFVLPALPYEENALEPFIFHTATGNGFIVHLRSNCNRFLAMIEPTAKKTGCLSFGVFSDIKNKNRFSWLGEWKPREALNQHIASHQFSVLLGTQALLCEPLDIQIFTVFRSEGLDAVHSIREPKSDKYRNLAK